jgi:hypothetical protein
MVLIIVIVGPVPGRGAHRSKPFRLAFFLIASIAAAMFLIARELRPAVSLLSSEEPGERNPRGLTSHL